MNTVCPTCTEPARLIGSETRPIGVARLGGHDGHDVVAGVDELAIGPELRQADRARNRRAQHVCALPQCQFAAQRLHRLLPCHQQVLPLLAVTHRPFRSASDPFAQSRAWYWPTSIRLPCSARFPSSTWRSRSSRVMRRCVPMPHQFHTSVAYSASGDRDFLAPAARCCRWRLRSDPAAAPAAPSTHGSARRLGSAVTCQA